MDRKVANTLKVGDEVFHVVDKVSGRVTSINPRFCVNIEWDDGKKGSVHPQDMAEFQKR